MAFLNGNHIYVTPLEGDYYASERLTLRILPKSIKMKSDVRVVAISQLLRA